MTNTIIVMLLVVTFISITAAIEKNEDNKKKQKEIDEIKDYTTSRWGFSREIEIDRLKKNLNDERTQTEFYKRMLDKSEEDYEKAIRTKEAYYSKLEGLYKQDQRTKEYLANF